MTQCKFFFLSFIMPYISVVCNLKLRNSRENPNDFQRNQSTTSQILTISSIIKRVHAENLEEALLKGRQGFFGLFRQPTLKNKNSEFKTYVPRLKTGLGSHSAHGRRLGWKDTIQNMFGISWWVCFPNRNSVVKCTWEKLFWALCVSTSIVDDFHRSSFNFFIWFLSLNFLIRKSNG